MQDHECFGDNGSLVANEKHHLNHVVLMAASHLHTGWLPIIEDGLYV
jgi:hypothetical protein